MECTNEYDPALTVGTEKVCYAIVAKTTTFIINGGRISSSQSPERMSSPSQSPQSEKQLVTVLQCASTALSDCLFNNYGPEVIVVDQSSPTSSFIC
jgi:hypothetical protein